MDPARLVETVFVQAIAAVVLLDRELRFVRANEAFASRFGLAAGALPGRRFADLVQGEALLESLEEAMRSGQPSTASAGTDDCAREGSGETCWQWMFAPVPDSAGRPEFLLLMAVDITDLRRAEAKLKASEALYQSVFACMNEGVVFQSADGSIVAANPAAERILGASAEQIRGRTSHAPEWSAVREDDTPFPGDEHPAMVTLRTGEPTTDVVMGVGRPDGGRAWISINCRPVQDAGEARPHGVVATFHDVSGRRAADERQLRMIQELNHRVKNTLATVQAIAGQTLKASPEPAAFNKAFSARLHALSRIHELLSRNDWTGAQMRAVIGEQLEAHRLHDGERLRLEGPDVLLTPKTAVALSLALGELAMNAAMHGALSVEGGRLDVAWDVSERGGGRRVRLLWRERGGPQVSPPTRQGLGARLIERSLAHELGGEARAAFDPEGLSCEIEFPLPDAAP